MLTANEAEFEHAAAYMRNASVAKRATQQQQLKLYALFKQATTGAYADVC
jgi:acyl-CoA-binding protein